MNKEISNKKDIVQKQALDAWKKAGKKATVFLITGLGKTKLSLMAVAEMPLDSKILFLAEQTDRERELRNEQQQWGITEHNITFACYQSAYKWENTHWDLVIADEVDTSLTPIYQKFFFNNSIGSIIGLTATIDKSARVYPDSETDFTTKIELLNQIAPICFSYTVGEGQKEGTARKLDVYVINHLLDTKTPCIKKGKGAKMKLVTEIQANSFYDAYMDNLIKTGNTPLIRIIANQRAKLLYNLPSKVQTTKALLEVLQGKTIIFANSLEFLDKVTPCVISSKKSESENESIRNMFDNGQIKQIGSFKKLERGANLIGLDNCVIASYFGSESKLVQRINIPVLYKLI